MRLNKWPEKIDSSRLLEKVVYSTCKAVDTPRSLAVWLLFSSKEHRQLVDLDIDPDMYDSYQAFGDDYLVTKMLSKYPLLETGIDTEAAALATFLACERQCAVTNTRLLRVVPNGTVQSVLDGARKIIRSCLSGHEADPKLPLSSITDSCTWGPGVTSSVKGEHVSRFNKLNGVLELTNNLYKVGGLALVACSPAWAYVHHDPLEEFSVKCRLTGGNTLTFVVKNAKTKRPIAIEPHLNAFLQRGIGVVMRELLLHRLGVDLRDQSLNQWLASMAVMLDLVTVDMKSASDTVAQGAVELLFEADWVHLLGCCRSQKYTLDGGKTWVPYHKWSSMGNGYTFELETLMFYSIARACTDATVGASGIVSVYGDDIIMPQQAYGLFINVATFVGFTINEEKSFSTGRFRESCGQDYFDGINVRPIFIREELNSAQAVYKLANAVKRYARLNMAYGHDKRFKEVWSVLYLALPKHLRHRIPSGYGDGGFEGDWDEVRPSLCKRRTRAYHRRWWRFQHLVFEPGEVRIDGPLAVASVLDTRLDQECEANAYIPGGKPLRLTSDASDRSCYALRGRGRWRLGYGFSPEWPSFGGWM